jgi:hypothetical protein
MGWPFQSGVYNYCDCLRPEDSELVTPKDSFLGRGRVNASPFTSLFTAAGISNDRIQHRRFLPLVAPFLHAPSNFLQGPQWRLSAVAQLTIFKGLTSPPRMARSLRMKGRNQSERRSSL